jgi:hypothetical protein
MDYSSYISTAKTKKDSWNTKITALKVEAEAEAAEREEASGSSSSKSSSTSSSSSSKSSSSKSTGSTNRLDALEERDVSIFSDIKITNDLDYASIIKTTNSRSSSISAQLKHMREKAEADEAREKSERADSTDTTDARGLGDSTNAKVIEEGKETLEDIKLRNEDPIEGFYKDILGRDSDPESKKHWQKKFDEGMSLTDIQEQFLRSDEYKNKKNK